MCICECVCEGELWFLSRIISHTAWMLSHCGCAARHSPLQMSGDPTRLQHLPHGPLSRLPKPPLLSLSLPSSLFLFPPLPSQLLFPPSPKPPTPVLASLFHVCFPSTLSLFGSLSLVLPPFTRRLSLQSVTFGPVLSGACTTHSRRPPSAVTPLRAPPPAPPPIPCSHLPLPGWGG